MSDKKQLEAKTIETSTRESSSADCEQGMLFQDEQGYIQAINPTAADILGLSAEEVIGCSLTDLSWQTIDEDGSPFKSETNPAMVAISTGKPCSNVVMGFYQLKGNLIWLVLDSQPLFQNDQTSLYAVITTFFEITEPKQIYSQTSSTQNNLVDDSTILVDRQRTEEALHEANQRIITAWESMTDAYVSLDREWRIIYANKAATQVIKQLTNLKPEQFLGRSHWEMFPSTVGQEVEREYRRAVLEQVAVHLEVLYEGYWFEVHAYPSEVGLGIYFRDISDRKQIEENLLQSEEKFRQLTENIDEAVFWIFNLETLQVLYVSPSYEKIWGGDRDSLYNSSRLWMEAIHPEDRPKVQSVIDQQQKGDRHDLEYRIMHPDGSLRWIRDRGFGLKDATGHPYRMVGIAEDITEQVQLVAREKAAREEAEQANRIKDEFLAILSHELRSPLNPILGWTQMFQIYQSDPTILQEGFNAIERSAKLLLELINDLLDVAKILRGKIMLNLAPVDLLQVIEGALETVSASAKAKSITIETNLNSSGQVNGDFARLQQIIWNLLSNAVKFTPNGGRIEITLDRVWDTAQIVVTDNGKGIPSEFLPHVFEYFRQADGSITRKHGGLGLGLALVRHLVELHGGVVTVNSLGINCGASFMVSLPLLITSSENKNFKSTPLSLTNKANLTGVQVLVVDDDRDNLEFLTMALRHHKASVLAATSATEALSLCEKFTPDILLSDIAMPEMDGLALIRSIRSRTPEAGGKIKAIALSAYAREIDQKQALAAGYQVHLSKPIQINTLITTIFNLWR
jgi:PAS domain S-box-containing protein